MLTAKKSPACSFQLRKAGGVRNTGCLDGCVFDHFFTDSFVAAELAR